MFWDYEVNELCEENFDLKIENVELKLTLAQRDAEIEALKHIIDRKDEEK